MPPPPPNPPAGSTFHEISLNDEVPNLEFSFGNETASKGKESSGLSNGFGGWGSSWGFGGLDKTSATQNHDDKSSKAKGSGDAFGDNNPWSLNKSKNKKNTVANEFDFGDFGASNGLDDLSLGTTGDDKMTADTAWGFASVNKKTGKKGKQATGEKNEPQSITALPEPNKETDDIWGSWGTKKDKKKGKKSGADESGPLPPPPPPAPVPPETDPVDEWTSFGVGTKKDKKNKKKDTANDVLSAKFEEPAIIATETDNAFDWAIGDSKNDKKKKKGNLISGLEEDSAFPAPPNAQPKAEDDDWMSNAWGKTKKDKKGKKGTTMAESTPAAESTAIPETTTTLAPVIADDEWSTWGQSKNKKEKKGKKGATDLANEVPPPPPPPPEPEQSNNAFSDLWGSSTTKTSKKAPKKGKNEPIVEDTSFALPEPDLKEPEDDFWGNLETKKGKKTVGKKAKNEPEPIVSIAPEPDANKVEDDIWGNFPTKKDKKAGTKKSKTDSEPVAPEVDAKQAENDVWGAFGAKKEKRGSIKKAKNEPEPAIPESQEPDATQAADDIWATFGTKKDKKNAKKGQIEAETAPAPAETNVKDTADDIWGNFGAKSTKKGTKMGKSDPDPLELSPESKTKDEKDLSMGNISKKDSKSGKKGKITEPEASPLAPVPVPEETNNDDTWGGWGLTTKEKKKKEKDAKKKGANEMLQEEPIKTDDPEPFNAPGEQDIWSAWGSKDTKKKSKKGKISDEPPPPAPTPPKQGLTPEPTDLDDFEGDTWADLTTTKSKTSAKKGSLSRTTTTTSKGTKAEDKVNSKVKASAADKDENTINPKDEKAAKEDSPAKAVKSIWGSFGGSTTTTKSKAAKEKEEKAKKDAAKAEEQAKAAEEAKALEAAVAAAAAVAAVEPKKGSKAKNGKLSKVDSKGSSNGVETGKKKGAADGLIDLLESPSEGKTDSKVKKIDSPKEEKGTKADVFSMWGAPTSKNKTAGKKGEKIEESKGEIKKPGSTNQKSALAGLAKGLESPIADELSPPATQPSTNKNSSKAMQSSTTKSSTKNGFGASSSVAARIKALEGKDESDAKKKKVDASAAGAKDTPAAPPDPPKDEKKNSKNSKGAIAGPAAKGKKKGSPVEEKAPKDFVPGSFPGAFGDDDDLLDLADPFSPSPEKKMKKATTTKKASAASGKKTKAADMLMDLPEAPEPPKLPTPPPEEKKPVKKERARIERTGAASSWGFWGAAPKKDVKKPKDDGDVAEPTPKKSKPSPGLTRSKSTKTAKEKQKEDAIDAEKVSRSSESAGGREKAAPSRPSTSRGKSFSSFLMGGPPPSASRPKTVRRSSTTSAPKSASRRQSMDVDATGMISPPPDDEPDVGGKAANLMGMGPSKPTKGKGKAKGTVNEDMTRLMSAKSSTAVPDPYAIDDDDMVMVNPIEDPIVNGVSSKNPPPKVTKSSKAKPKSKREVSNKPTILKSSSPKSYLWSSQPSTYQNDLDQSRPSWDKNFARIEANGKVYFQQSKRKATDTQDDTVMIDAGGEPQITSGPDDITFVDHAPPRTPLKRSNTSSKRTSGIFGGLFGSGGGSAPTRGRGMSVSERPRSGFYDTDAIVEPSRPSREKPKRRSTYRSNRERETDGEGFTTDAAGATTEAEDPVAAEARRADRRAKRDAKEQASRDAEEAEEREREERRVRRKEKERADLEARRAKARDIRRREQEADDQRREEKRVKRREKEEQRAREDEEAAASAEARREERRRLREKLEAEQGAAAGTSKSRADRRKSYAMEEEDRLKRRETKKSEKSSRRKSMMPGPIDDYFDPRNGAPSGPAEPVLHGAPPDKTSSWVNDLADNPPDAPPVEGTVLEDPPTERVSDERRAKRESRRHSKYAGLTEGEIEERRARKRETRRTDKEKSVSGGSREDGDAVDGGGSRRRKSVRRRDTADEDYDAYVEGGPVKTFDGRPTMGGKRNSWFSKLKGF